MLEKDSIRERVMEHEESICLRAAVYARTSSVNQKHGYSLDAQVSRCVDRCETLGWDVRFVYRDRAESGKDTDRPMFKKMLGAAEKQEIDVIVFWKLDRFSRSLMHAVQLESELRNSEVSLYSVTEQIDTTSATGRFNFRSLASAAEFERDMITQRTQMGLAELAAEQKWPNDSPPLGYDLDSEGRLEVNTQGQDLVTTIFELYIEEQSMPEVAWILNEQGYQTKDGSEWTSRAVGDILRNEIYTGQYEVASVSKHVEDYQIIDQDTFNEVTSIRFRFQNGEDTSLRSMDDPRKEHSVQKMRAQYAKYCSKGDRRQNPL